MKYTLVQTRGFTIIETMVAISVLIVAIMAPITIAARGLQSAFYVKQHLTAVYLAQEELELLRSVRDTEVLNHNADWTSVFGTAPASSCGGSSGCDFDVTFGFVDCASSGSTACVLRYNPSAISGGDRGMYTHTAGVGIESPFTRVVHVEHVTVDSTDEVRVTVTVTWQAGLFGGSKSVVLQGVIFNQSNAS